MNDTTWTDEGLEDLGSYDGIKDGPPPPLDDGIYELRIVKAVRGLTKEHKKPKADLEIKVLHAYGNDETLNRKTYLTLVFTKETKFRLLNVARAAGIEPPTGKPTPDVVDAFCTELVQAGSVWGKLVQEPDNKGGRRSNVKFFLREEQIQSALNGTLGQETGATEAPQVARRRR